MARPDAGRPIVGKDGTMEPAFRDQINRFYDQFPLAGVGNPNGVVEGEYMQLYLNIIGTTGSIEWRKMLVEVNGDKKLGWVAV